MGEEGGALARGCAATSGGYNCPPQMTLTEPIYDLPTRRLQLRPASSHD